MANGIKVTIVGFAALQAAALRKSNAVRDATMKQIQESTIRVESDAKTMAPVDTGRLRSSIQRDIKGLKGIVFTKVTYAPFIEFGTMYMRAQPFLQPAVEIERNKLPSQFRQFIGDAVRNG